MSRTLEEIAEEAVAPVRYFLPTFAAVREYESAILAALREARDGALREAAAYCYQQGETRALMRSCKALGDEILALASRPAPEPAPESEEPPVCDVPGCQFFTLRHRPPHIPFERPSPRTTEDR